MPQNIDATLKKRSGMTDKPILLRWLDKRPGESIEHRRQGVLNAAAACTAYSLGKQDRRNYRGAGHLPVVQRRLAYGLRSRIVRMSHYLHFVPFMHVILPGDAATLTVAHSMMMPDHRFIGVMPRSFGESKSYTCGLGDSITHGFLFR